ncbi:site-2 protease family protein [Pseudoduganella armeniaca]|uniref:Site-2 protease family protein n=1 Tax=Pseudoduganella armeniaca TaxID=2072590 RepID=A0A2R4CEH6_9BURK|nr:site-2 protease family protein [Pseudoduganella armeniaca]AVR98034.1 site-2 protease family protein [Pseudoduganella armeniaca]
MSELDLVIRNVALYAIPVLFAISLHEAAHGYVARYFGDHTASEQGRLSANPMRHIDPFGTIVLPLLTYYFLHMPFGYAKPVPVDYSRLRNPKKQMGFVAAAGPAANFAMALGWAIWGILLAGMHVTEPFLVGMAQGGVIVNAVMCVFNLIPVPPLDGGRIVTAVLPLDLARSYARLELYTPYIFLGLIVLMYLGALSPVLTTLVAGMIQLIMALVTPLALLLT